MTKPSGPFYVEKISRNFSILRAPARSAAEQQSGEKRGGEKERGGREEEEEGKVIGDSQ